MIKTYKDYIDDYITKDKLRDNRPVPGEHHFVSVYLVPRLINIRNAIPLYVNPDGMKNVAGDIIFDRGKDKPYFSIEVKLGTIRLSKREYNSWIVSNDEKFAPPNIFIGIGTKGIGLCPWPVFSKAYIDAICVKDPTWQPQRIEKGYGPKKEVNFILDILPSDKVFVYDTAPEEADRLEQLFHEKLRDLASE